MSVIRTSNNRSQDRAQRSSPYSPYRLARTAINLLVSTIRAHPQKQPQLSPLTVEKSISPLHEDSSSTQSSATLPSSQDLESQSVSAPQQPTTPPRLLHQLEPRRHSPPIPISLDTLSPSIEYPQSNTEHKFTFTFTTPGREFTPLPSPASASPPSLTSTPSSSPRKRLSKNPNGNYRWEGAGSAKYDRQRNRHGSPAFAISPSKSDRRLVDSTNKSEELPDPKRRRIGGPDLSVQQLVVSRPTKQPQYIPFPLSSPVSPLTRTANEPLPSTPPSRSPLKATYSVIPSPLRQAWSNASPPRDDNKISPSQKVIKPSTTSSYMAELIKETKPSKKPDLANPYQDANPVGKATPPRRGTKRIRATGRLTLLDKTSAGSEKHVKEKNNLPPLSPQAIIEATLPKGSKRSRPPAELITSPSPFEESHIVDKRDHEAELGRSSKRSKISSEDVTVGEVVNHVKDRVKENVGEGPKLTVNGNGRVNANSKSILKTSTVPKEPSKLRFSFQAEGKSITPSPEPDDDLGRDSLAFINFAPPPPRNRRLSPELELDNADLVNSGSVIKFTSKSPQIKHLSPPHSVTNPIEPIKNSSQLIPSPTTGAAAISVQLKLSEDGASEDKIPAPSGKFDFKCSRTTSSREEYFTAEEQARCSKKAHNVDIGSLPISKFIFPETETRPSSTYDQDHIKCQEAALAFSNLKEFPFTKGLPSIFKFDLTPPKPIVQLRPKDGPYIPFKWKYPQPIVINPQELENIGIRLKQQPAT